MTTTEKVGHGERVDRGDIEAKLREIRGEVDSLGDSSRSYVLAAGAVVAVAVLALAFTLGRRKGKRRTTLVEVRRV